MGTLGFVALGPMSDKGVWRRLCKTERRGVAMNMLSPVKANSHPLEQLEGQRQ